jgi:tetratricopeptide (TPR) repeat protein
MIGKELPQPNSLHRERGRRIWFILVAAALPCLLVCGLEVGLRLGGYGYDTRFFVPFEDGANRYLVENFKFGWRFFPRKIARSPIPAKIEAHKPPGTIRVFLFGESAAMGDPEPAYGLGRQVQRMVQSRHPTNRVEVVNVAMTAINSHVIREIARDCARLEGDVWLIYAGNNEVVGPFGAGTVFGPTAPRLGFVRATLATKRLRIVQWLAGLRENSAAPREWEGMEFFLHNQVAATDPRLRRVYENFEGNLSAIVDAGQKAGARVIVGTMAVNLKDCPPFGSMHRAGLTGAELKTWDDRFGEGKNEEASGDFSKALASYGKAAQIDSQYAELVYRRGKCEVQLGQAGAANADFSLARDLDSLRFRADSELNRVIRKVAEARGIPLIDSGAVLGTNAATGIPGDEFFYDHVHLNFAGNHRLAAAMAGRIEQELFGGKGELRTLLNEEEVERELAFTEFDQHRVGEEMQLRLQQPPFSTQSNFRERDERWRNELASRAPDGKASVWEYRAALALSPDDAVMRANFARLLESTGDKAGAKEQWTLVVEQLSHEPDGYYHLGNLAYDAGRYDEAAVQFRLSLRWRPWSSEAHNALGLALAARGQTKEAGAEYEKALKGNPRFSAARINRAALLAWRGNTEQAVQEYETVLRTDSNNAAAEINLAKLFFGEGKTNEALRLYTHALETRPDNAIGHFDLGNALNSQGRHEEALAQYQLAVQYQPGFVDAHYNVALELARIGKINEALSHLETAVRLNPKFAEAHFNYGVALAKLQRYSEAVTEFEETLKLEPNHTSARSLLNRARELSSGIPKQNAPLPR